jgi:glycosyltransferase involved in cell wall biosynthesis
VSVCRLVPNKRVDLVVEAFRRTGLPLVVIGDGPERQRLEALASGCRQIQFLGRLEAPEVSSWLEECRAYVYAGLEDFGIAPVEAMAAGAPVIAYGNGGILDSVQCLQAGQSAAGCANPPTGLLFPVQSASSLAAALVHFESAQCWRDLPAEGQRRAAERFAPECFHNRMQALLERLWAGHRNRLDRLGGAVPLL